MNSEQTGSAVEKYDFPADELAPDVSRAGLWWRRLIMILLLLWTVNISWIAQLTGWSGEVIGYSPTILTLPVLALLVQFVLLAPPLTLAAGLGKIERYRSMSALWLAASGLLLVLAPARLWPSTHAQLTLLSQIGLLWIYGSILDRWLPKTDLRNESSHFGYGILLATGVGVLVTLPWFVIGSIGSALDLILNVALAIWIGRVTNLLFTRLALQTQMNNAHASWRSHLSSGLVTGTTLLIIAGALSMNGVQLMLMAVLSATGWLLNTLANQQSTALLPGPGWAVGSICAVVLVFTDTDAAILQAADRLLVHYFAAGGIAVMVGVGLGLIATPLRRRLGQVTGSPAAAVMGIAFWSLGLFVYLQLGQPGFYGDGLFIIMNEQADVSEAKFMEDYDGRRRFVYETLSTHAVESQANLRVALDRLNIAHTPYYLVNGLEVKGGALLRLWLNSRSEVDRILFNPQLRPLFREQRPVAGSASVPAETMWNLRQIGADRVWNRFGVRGAGIVVGQSDSGVQYDHPELADGYRGRSDNHDYSWFDPWAESAVPQDISGHGTHTLGTVLGNSVGVAPDAEWIACANLYRNLGNPALYLDCMQFMLAPFPVGGDPFIDGDPTRSAHVLNNSWGCPEEFEGCDSESLHPAVSALRAAGLFVVASAGNSGPACATVTDSIAIYDEVLSVGAVNKENDLAVFSSVGPVTVDGSRRIKPDVVAPGVDILSAYPRNTYEIASGTSMAGPHVAGVVALIWSANPKLIGKIDLTEQILLETAHPFTGTLDMMIPAEVVEFVEESRMPDIFGGLLSPETPNEACITQIDPRTMPNALVGNGTVDAFRAVEMALRK